MHRVGRGPRVAYGLGVQGGSGITAAASLVRSLMMRRWLLLMQGCLGLWLCSILVRVAHWRAGKGGRVARGRRCDTTALSLLTEALLGVQALQTALRPAIQSGLLPGVGRGFAGSVVHGRRIGARHH